MNIDTDVMKKRVIITRTGFIIMLSLFMIYCMWHVVKTTEANNNVVTWVSVFDFVGTIGWICSIFVMAVIAIVGGCYIIGSTILWFWNGCLTPKWFMLLVNYIRNISKKEPKNEHR